MRISIDKTMTILSIIGEEDSIGFEDDQAVQQAIGVIQGAIDQKVKDGQLSPEDTLITFV